MQRRCNNPKSSRYADYGGRGITVCDRWQDVALFHKDMSAGYVDGLTLDRIDNEKGYSPENCRWATAHQQMRNRRSNIKVTIGGRTQILKDWCKELGINYHSAYNRITKMGWEPEQALRTPFLAKGEPRVLVRP